MKTTRIKTVFCPFCGRGQHVFINENDVDNNEEIKEYKCSYCKQSFKLKGDVLYEE